MVADPATTLPPVGFAYRQVENNRSDSVSKKVVRIILNLSNFLCNGCNVAIFVLLILSDTDLLFIFTNFSFADRS